MFKITRFTYVFLNIILVACATASPALSTETSAPTALDPTSFAVASTAVPAPTAIVQDLPVPAATDDQPIARSTVNSPASEFLPASTLVAIPVKNLGHVSTIIGDLEFTTLRFPTSDKLSSVTSTAYGLVAIILRFRHGYESASLRWSTGGETWEGISIPTDARVVTAAGDDIIVSTVYDSNRTRLIRYARESDGFIEIARLDFEGVVRQIVFGSRGAVVVSDDAILYSTDRIDYY